MSHKDRHAKTPCPNPVLSNKVDEIVEFMEWRSGKPMYKMTTHEIQAAMSVYEVAIKLCDE